MRTNGKTRERNMPLAEKLKGAEDVVEGAVRGIIEEIGSMLKGTTDEEKKQAIIVKEETVVQRKEEKDSPSYPGLQAREWSRTS